MNKDMVELLIRSGADVNARDNRDSTPLNVATHMGYAEIVEILTKAAEVQQTEEKNP